MRVLNAAGDGPASINATVTTPQLTSITGTSGNDAYIVRRNANNLEIFENAARRLDSQLIKHIAALGASLTIETGEGDKRAHGRCRGDAAWHWAIDLQRGNWRQ